MTPVRSHQAADVLDALETAIHDQKKALIDGSAADLAAASDALARALATLRSASPTPAQAARLRRLRGLVGINAELLTRASSADRRQLEALLGPRPTYGAQPASAARPAGTRRLGTA